MKSSEFTEMIQRREEKINELKEEIQDIKRLLNLAIEDGLVTLDSSPGLFS